MDQIWSPDWKFRRWAEIEIAAAKALGAPSDALTQMSTAVVPSAQAVATEEASTRHDVIAFLNLWRKSMGSEGQAWSHRGLTSSDIVDTANALRFKASTDALRASLRQLTSVIGNQAIVYKDAVRVGRTHGQSAEVTTWGWRLAGFTYDLLRAEKRFALMTSLYECGKLSGPVGDYKTMTPAAEQDALHRLGLSPVGACTQVVPRDVYVDYVHCLAQMASVVENIALEVRLSSRSEVAEMREGTLASQRGSSAMPHKRNPITAEQLSGLARIVRAQVDPIAQGVALHHERDLSHSSVERLALALASRVTDYMLMGCTTLMRNLRVYPERMRANVLGNLDVLSSMIKDRLITHHGLDPKTAYEVTFWGFQDWTRPEGDRGPDSPNFETLADSLTNTFNMIAEREHWEPAGVPDFDEMVAMLDQPENLVGRHNGDVYTEIDYFVNPDKYQRMVDQT
jgi:adenylosuccinate lyase